jgi:hypothetical protein
VHLADAKCPIVGDHKYEAQTNPAGDSDCTQIPCNSFIHGLEEFSGLTHLSRKFWRGCCDLDASSDCLGAMPYLAGFCLTSGSKTGPQPSATIATAAPNPLGCLDGKVARKPSIDALGKRRVVTARFGFESRRNQQIIVFSPLAA